MKKGLYIAIAALLIFALVGCATQASPAQRENTPRDVEKDSVSATDTQKTPPATEITPAPQASAAPVDTEPKTVQITAKEAVAAALAHAGVTETQVRDLEAELEKERGELYYEVSFEAGPYDYEYLIGVDSAEVVHFEKEIDD